MIRDDLLRIEQKLLDVLSKEKVTWDEAETISEALVDTVRKSREDGITKFTSSTLFYGNSPET